MRLLRPLVVPRNGLQKISAARRNTRNHDLLASFGNLSLSARLDEAMRAKLAATLPIASNADTRLHLGIFIRKAALGECQKQQMLIRRPVHYTFWTTRGIVRGRRIAPARTSLLGELQLGLHFPELGLRHAAPPAL